MNPFDTTLKDIDQFCNSLKLQYAIIGGLALIAHKIRRTTKDIDVNLLIELENIELTGKEIITKFNPIFSDSILFFQSNFVLPVKHKESKIQIDFAAGLSEFDKQVIRRSVRKKFDSL